MEKSDLLENWIEPTARSAGFSLIIILLLAWTEFFSSIALIVIFGVTTGLTIGLSQWSNVAKRISNRNLWVFVNIVGFALGIAITIYLVGVISDRFSVALRAVTTYDSPDIYIHNESIKNDLGLFVALFATFGTALLGATLGCIIGVVQVISFRGQLDKPIRWVWQSTLSWALGLTVGVIAALVIEYWNGDKYYPIWYSGYSFSFLGFLYSYDRSMFVSGIASNVILAIRLFVLGISIGATVGLITGILYNRHLDTDTLQGTDTINVFAKTWKNSNLLVKLSSSIGLLLALMGLGLGLYLISANAGAKLMNGGESKVSGGPCIHPILNINTNRTVITEKDSEAIQVSITNDDNFECDVEVRIYAPNFEISPPEFTHTISLSAKETAEIIWIVTPKELGTYQVGVQADLESVYLGIIVTSVLGLTAQQMEIATYLGTFFGPAFTLPWLYTVWKERKKEKNEQKEKERETEIALLQRQLLELKTKQESKKWWQFWK